MKIRIALVLTLAGTALISLALKAPQGDQGGDTQLGQYMGNLQQALRGLGKSMGADDPDFDAALTEVCGLQELCLKAKNEVPAKVAAMDDEKKKAKAAVGFRLQMHELIRGLLDVEAALLEEDAKKANKAIRALNKTKGKGHGKYKD
jgi:hypothetical protein